MAAKATHSTSNRRGFIQLRRGFYDQRFVQAHAVAHEDLGPAEIRHLRFTGSKKLADSTPS
jgi:hypothetical protein